eukprot:11539223-Alexandrium_andersonii.AAC.1
MSASLVGSEMCIRDRSCTPCKRQAQRSRSAPCGPRRCRQRKRVGRRAVSYTHLTLPTICSV